MTHDRERKAYRLPIPDIDTPKNTRRALYWKAHLDPLATIDDSRRTALILKTGIGSADLDFVMEIVGQWRIANGFDSDITAGQ